MANIQAGDRLKAPYAGDLGNKGVWSGYHQMAAAGALGDTIDLCVVPAGAKIFGCEAAWSAHGTDATLAIGWKYKDGSSGGAANAIKAAASSAAAGNSVSAFLPITADKDIVIYVTNAGAAIPDDGEVFVAVSGEYVGNA